MKYCKDFFLNNSREFIRRDNLTSYKYHAYTYLFSNYYIQQSRLGHDKYAQNCD